MVIDECISAGQFAQACCINRNCNPQHNLLLNPKQLFQTVQHPDWNRQLETGAEHDVW